MSKKSNLFAVLITVLSFILFSCEDDKAITNIPVSDSLIAQAQKVLKDSIVLNATAMMGTVNKTLLDEGCPLKYFFSWKSDDTLNIQIRNLSVGKMPLSIWFSINVKFMKLNTWEQEEYPEEDWIKFKGYNGITNYNGNTEEYSDGEGGAGIVTGYYNAKTEEIEFVTNFNVMNMSCDVYRQEIDTTRINNYEEEFTQYEEDLAKYKEEHGL
jgi:hypothetical protein